MTTLQMWVLVGVILAVRGVDETVANLAGWLVLIACAAVAIFG